MNLRLLCSLGSLLAVSPAWAVDYFVVDVAVVPANGAAGPGWKPAAGEDLRLDCRWKGTSAPGEASKFNPDMKGQILLDGKPLGLPSAGFSMSAPIHTSSDWKATPGKHRMGCMADAGNLVAETNESNNVKQLDFIVLGAGSARVMSTAQASVHANTSLPSANARSCKSMVYSTVQLDKSQFSALDGVPDTNAVKLTLDLTASHALGNYVHCEYRSAGKDVQMVYTYPCANAQKKSGAQHIYSCE